MEVILLNDVENVGLRGDVVDVKRGYARNFLLPRGFAAPATEGRLAALRRRDELRARQEARSFEEGQQIADAIRGTELRFEMRAGSSGALFGSVTPTDIVDELWRERKVRVDRRKVDLPEPIKRIGRYDIPIEVFTDVTVEVRALVAPEGGELPPEQAPVEPETTPEPQSVAGPETVGTESAAEGEDVDAEPVEQIDAEAAGLRADGSADPG